MSNFKAAFRDYQYRNKTLKAAYQTGRQCGQATRRHVEYGYTFTDFVKDFKPQMSLDKLRQAWNKGEQHGYAASGESIMKPILNDALALIGIIMLVAALLEGWWLVFRAPGSSLFFPM